MLRAIRQYATSSRKLDPAVPLLGAGGFLIDADVRAQFAAALDADGRADAALVGQRWKSVSGVLSSSTDFTAEARILLGYFAAHSAELAPVVGDSGTDTPISPAELEAATEDLSDLGELAAFEFGESTRGVPDGVRIYLRDQTALIAESTRNFVGRRFLFQQIAEVIAGADRGYCYVVADPGVGKTALLAQFLKQERYVHHFNVRTINVAAPEAFLANVCAQLIATYRLPYDALPEGAIQDSSRLVDLLAEAAAAAGGEKIVIAIDALDEADSSQLLPGTNPMYLPTFIPDGCFILITTRPDDRDQPPRIRVSCEQTSIVIDPLGSDNLADIRAHINQWCTEPGIQSFMQLHGLDRAGFVEHLAYKSAGNFMYLHHMLPAIDRGDLQDRDLADIPLGLDQYYSDHVERMRGRDDTAWFEYKLKVVAALSAISAPLTAPEIAYVAEIPDIGRVQDALRAWGEFLKGIPVTDRGIRRTAYRIYHASFHDFLEQLTIDILPQERLMLARVMADLRDEHRERG